MKYYSDNTLTNFVTRLPRRIELEGQWEVGLVEIQYPHNWYNVPSNTDRLMTLSRVGENSRIDMNYFEIPPGYYKPDVLLQRIKTLAAAATNQSEIYIVLEYDEVDMTYVSELRGYMLDVGPHVSSLLGLERTYIPAQPHRGRVVMDIDPIDSLYVYCDIIESRIVGDVLAPLLRVIPVKGKHGETILKSYENVHYVPLQRKTFQTMEIDIRDRTGKAVPFERGTLSVTLHFRRKRSIL